MKHTPGAIRAAEVIVQMRHMSIPFTIDNLANLIDRETHVPELLEVCTELAAIQSNPGDAVIAKRCRILADKARAAIAEATPSK